MNITTFGEVDERSLEQLMRCMAAGDAAYGVLCADHHPGYAQPIGSAIAYKDKISVSGVGYDIGCGNTAYKTNLLGADIVNDLPTIMDTIYNNISFGMGRKNKNQIKDHPLFDEIANADFVPQRSLLQLAKDQLGTVGGGNHYVDIFADDNDNVWVGVHFGSRGFGHKTASGFLSIAQGGKFEDRGHDGEMDSEPVLLDTNSVMGQDYINAMRLAGKYAAAGRHTVIQDVLAILGYADVVDIVSNHHNYAWLEEHFGEEYWVVRKGCTPLHPTEWSFVGSNMRDASMIIEGLNTPEIKNSLYSTVHGAGRIMSRRAATGKTKYINGVKTVVKPGLVDWEATKKEMYNKLIELRGGGADEAPQVYKNLADVIAYHSDTTREVLALYPIGVAMAGEEVFDAYKD